MGRPKGSKNKPKDANGAAAAGHNTGGLSDDQRYALTSQHLRLYEKALAAKKKADADFKNACKKAKAELGATAIDDIKDMIALGTPEGEAALKVEIERKMRIARWMGLPVGAEPDLFSGETPDVAYQAGKRAGLAGEPRKPPYAPGTADEQDWLKGHGEGQAVLATGIKPLTMMPEDDGEEDDEDEGAAAADDTADAVGNDDDRDLRPRHVQTGGAA